MSFGTDECQISAEQVIVRPCPPWAGRVGFWEEVATEPFH